MITLSDDKIVNVEIQKARKLYELKKNCADKITAKYPEYKQLNILMEREENPEAFNEMKNFIKSCRDECNDLETEYLNTL